MAKITRFRCVDGDGKDVPCAAFGNNVAFDCPKCGYPMLAIVREHQRGSSAAKPTECPSEHKAWVTVDTSAAKLLRLQWAN